MDRGVAWQAVELKDPFYLCQRVAAICHYIQTRGHHRESRELIVSPYFPPPSPRPGESVL